MLTVCDERLQVDLKLGEPYTHQHSALILVYSREINLMLSVGFRVNHPGAHKGCCNISKPAFWGCQVPAATIRFGTWAGEGSDFYPLVNSLHWNLLPLEGGTCVCTRLKIVVSPEPCWLCLQKLKPSVGPQSGWVWKGP